MAVYPNVIEKFSWDVVGSTDGVTPDGVIVGC